MKSNDEIIEQLSGHITDFISSAANTNWITNEVKDSYRVDAGNAWLADDLQAQYDRKMPTLNINLSGPIVDAVAGFQIQNRTVASYTPRLTTEMQEGFSDIVEKTVQYINDDAHVPFHNSQAFRDMLVCGVGATETYICYDENPDGEAVVERIFPGFLMWDVSAKEKNLRDANWILRADITTAEVARQMLDDAGEDDFSNEKYNPNIGNIDDSWFIKFFDVLASTSQTITVIYKYQWREKETYFRFKNPFTDELIGMAQQGAEMGDALLLDYIMNAVPAYGIDLTDRIFNLKRKDYYEIRKALDQLGIPYEKGMKQQRWKYFRATVIGGTVTEKSESFSQTGFTIKAMTGAYSEVDQYHYGMYRGMKPNQRLINQSMSDLQGAIQSAPLGGVFVEEDAVADMQAFVDTYASAKDVTILRNGSIAGGKELKAVFGAVSAVGEQVKDAIFGLARAFINVVAAAGKFIALDFKGAAASMKEANREASNSTKQLGDAVDGTTAKIIYSLEKRQQANDKARKLQAVTQSETNKLLVQSRETLTDETASYAEKTKALNEVTKAERASSAEKVRIAAEDLKIAQARAKAMGGEAEKKMKQELRELTISLNEAETENAQTGVKLNKQRKMLNAQQNADAKASQSERDAQAKEAEAKKKEQDDAHSMPASPPQANHINLPQPSPSSFCEFARCLSNDAILAIVSLLIFSRFAS